MSVIDARGKASVVLNLLLIGAVCTLGAWVWNLKEEGARFAQALKEDDKGVATYEAYIDASHKSNAYVGRKFPKIECVDISGREVSTDFADKRGGLILLFSPTQCQPCIVTQLKSLQHIHENLFTPDEFPVISFAEAKPAAILRFTRPFNLEYPVISSAVATISDAKLTQVIPIVFLVDRNNTIIRTHLPSRGRPEFSLSFYKEIYETQIKGNLDVGVAQPFFALGGVRAIDVIANRFDATSVSLLH